MIQPISRTHKECDDLMDGYGGQLCKIVFKNKAVYYCSRCELVVEVRHLGPKKGRVKGCLVYDK